MIRAQQCGGPVDFNYSQEAEAFRHEFRAWLEANLPESARKGDEMQGEFMRAVKAAAGSFIAIGIWKCI